MLERYRFLIPFIFLLIFSVIYLLNQYTFNKADKKPGNVILSSGPRNSAYYVNAEYIRNVLDSAIGPNKVENIPSDGSLENFERLESKNADLIIARRDVAIEKYYHKDDPYKNLEIILPLFQEALQIIVHDTSTNETISYKVFEKRIASGKIKTIAIGPKGSSTNRTFRNIMACINDTITPSSLFDERPIEEAIDAYEQGKIDCIVDFVAPPFSNTFRGDGLYSSLVSFDTAQLELLTSYFKELDIIHFSTEIYFGKTSNNREIQTIGTWAFLLGSPSVNQMLLSQGKKSLGNILITDIASKIQGLDGVKLDSNNIWKAYKDLALVGESNGKFAVDTAKKINRDRFFQSMPLSDAVSELWDAPSAKGNFLLLSFFTVIIILSYLIYEINHILVFFRLKPINFSLSFLKLKDEYGHWLVTFAITLGILLTFSFFIHQCEIWNYQRYNVKSSLLNLTFSDTLEWLLIYMSTHHEANFFPLSPVAKFLTSITFFVESGAFFIAFVFHHFIHLNIKKRNMGQIPCSAEGHYVICGWNEKTYELANGILHSEKYAGEHSIKVILVNDIIGKKIREIGDEKFKTNFKNAHIEFYSGNPADIKVLDEVEIHKAKKVIIVSDAKCKKSDEKVMLTAYAISTHCKTANYKHEYIIAEISDPAHIRSLKEAGVDVVISTGELVNSLIIQDTVCAGIYNPIIDLIRYDDYSNDFFSVPVSHYRKQLLGHTFDELHSLLRKQHLQLIGFKQGINGDESKAVYIINPQTPEENALTTAEGDEIIVLAIKREHLKKIAHLEARLV